ncbi:hypothetical protein [Methylobacterium sp. JK268]
MMEGSNATATDLQTNRGFESAWNRVQIGVEALVGLVVVAGLLGLFGDGWLARAEQPLAGTPLVLRYDRFLRVGAPSRLVVDIWAPVRDDALAVTVGADLLRKISIDATQPRAEAVDATPSGVTYRFRLGPEHAGQILFTLSPRDPGPVAASVTALGRRADFFLLIYP